MELEITFGLVAKLAAADGAVSSREVKIVEKLIDDILKLDATQRSKAIEFFNKAKKSEETFADYAERYKKLMASKPEMLTWMIDVLFKISYADRDFSENEIKMLKQASEIFKVPLTKYEKYFSQNNLDAEFALLGCCAEDTFEQITVKYETLCENYSPDKMLKLGLPKEFIDLAEAKVSQFTAAFSEIKKKSGS